MSMELLELGMIKIGVEHPVLDLYLLVATLDEKRSTSFDIPTSGKNTWRRLTWLVIIRPC